MFGAQNTFLYKRAAAHIAKSEKAASGNTYPAV